MNSSDDFAANFPPDVRQRIDEHLEAIETALRSRDVPISERRNVIDDVESQIIDMLAGAAGDRPTVADVDSVLSQLDPPSAYAEQPLSDLQGAPEAAQPPKRRRLSRAALVGAIWAAFFPLAILPASFLLLHIPSRESYRQAQMHRLEDARRDVAVSIGPSGVDMAVSRNPEARRIILEKREPERPVVVVTPELSDSVEKPTEDLEAYGAAPSGGTDLHPTVYVNRIEQGSAPFPIFVFSCFLLPFALLGLTAPLGTTILGIIGIVQIRASAGRLYGLGLAWFDALLFPGLALLAGIGALIMWIVVA